MITVIMAGHEKRVKLIINHGKQLGRSLLLLAYYATVFMGFVGRFAQWMVGAVKWTSTFARYTTSAFDFIYQHLHWSRRRSINTGTKEICPCSDMEPQ